MGNILLGPGFEGGSWFTPWPGYTTSGTHVDGQDTVIFHSELASVRCVVTSATMDGGRNQGSNENPALANMPPGQYFFFGWVKTGAGVTNAHCLVRERTTFAALAGGHITNANQDWTQVGGMFITTQVFTMDVLVGLGSYGAASGGTAYFDDIYLSQVPPNRRTLLGVGT